MGSAIVSVVFNNILSSLNFLTGVVFSGLTAPDHRLLLKSKNLACSNLNSHLCC